MDLTAFVQAAGYVGVAAIVFVESGLLVGFFLPGDSLLFAAGLLAAQGFFSLPWLILITFLAAVIGDNVGYAFGRRWGRRLFQKKEGRFFHKDNLTKAEAFYKEYGAKTIVLARFIPFIRTFAPIVAGIAEMPYSVFVTYNLVGGALWSAGLLTGSFYLGRLVPNLDRYLLIIIFVIVLASIWPAWREVRRKQSP